MPCDKRTPGKTHFLLFTGLVCLLLSGCAGQRWADPLPEEEQEELTRIITTMLEVEKQCPDNLDADALLFGKSPLDDWAVAGYMQLLSPSFIKFVVSNPLGQPVYAFASNGIRFQILHPSQYLHIRGNVRSLASRKEVPQILIQGNWFAYLTGRLPADLSEGMEVNRDASDSSVWLRISPPDSGRKLESAWVHVNPLQKTVLGYLFLDSSGETVAEIVYGSQQEGSDSCKPEDEVTITGLPWGAELKIELKEINTSNQFSEKDFSLPVPPGYTTQLQL